MTHSADEEASSSLKPPELLLLNLKTVADAVESEYLENDRRLNWFLLFQAFLFQGYATALQAITGANQGHASLLRHATLLMVCIIVVGLITSVLTLISTKAGIEAIEKLKLTREHYRKAAEAYDIATDGWFPKSDPLHGKGLLPTKWGPPALLIAWILVALHLASTFLCW